MDKFLTVFLSYYLNLFDTVPHAAAHVGILLRSTSKRIRTEFDAMYDQKRWWLLIHERFIPNLTGMPSDLKTVYYLKLIRNYFAPLELPSTHMAKYINYFVEVLRREKSPSLKTGGLLNSLRQFTHTAEGRVYMLRIIDDVEQRISDDVARGILNTLRSFFRYSFLVNYGCVVETGRIGGYELAVYTVDNFKEWRC
jgi:hypothetical protein